MPWSVHRSDPTVRVDISLPVEDWDALLEGDLPTGDAGECHPARPRSAEQAVVDASLTRDAAAAAAVMSAERAIHRG
jgi:hypothetical protein